MAPQIDVTEVLLDPIIAGERFIVTRRLEVVNSFGERTESDISYFATGSITPVGDNSLVREEGYQIAAKTIRVITAFMLRGPGKGPPQPTISQDNYDPDMITWRNDLYVVKSISDYSRFGAGMIEAECSSIDYVDQAPVSVIPDNSPTTA